jgi:MOSC domain-containing protein YiiM
MELHDKGYELAPGAIGENITTKGIDLLSLPRGAHLLIGPDAVVCITGLRNPCSQLDRHSSGLMKALLDKDRQGNMRRKAGVMGTVLAGGQVRPGDAIRIEMPLEPYRALEPV